MAIDRGPWNALVDDDGSNLVGSIWNKAAIKDVILDPTDAAIAAAGSAPVIGTWTPTDISGAGLALTAAGPSNYWQLGRLMIIHSHVIYPATSDPQNAYIGGLPVPNGATYGGLYAGNAAQYAYLIVPSASGFQVYSNTGLPMTNTALSGASLVVSGLYLTA